MKNFDIEIVSWKGFLEMTWLWMKPSFWFSEEIYNVKMWIDFKIYNVKMRIDFKIYKNVMFFQLVHDHYVRYKEQEMVEFVWVRCKICTRKFGEVRVLDESPQHAFKRLLSTEDLVASTVNRGLCCSLFKAHLEVSEKSCIFKIGKNWNLRHHVTVISFLFFDFWGWMIWKGKKVSKSFRSDS
jgi:hypothetical protein